MFERTKIDGRTFIGKEFDEVIELPDLIDVQLSSYESFLQKDALIAGDRQEANDSLVVCQKLLESGDVTDASERGGLGGSEKGDFSQIVSYGYM